VHSDGSFLYNADQCQEMTLEEVPPKWHDEVEDKLKEE